MEYYITRNYHLYLKFFEQSLLDTITTIFLQVMLVSIRLENLLYKNIFVQNFKKFLKSKKMEPLFCFHMDLLMKVVIRLPIPAN